MFARGDQRDDPGGDSQAEDPDGDRPPSHAAIVSRRAARLQSVHALISAAHLRSRPDAANRTHS
jgi:hypothetical protein